MHRFRYHFNRTKHINVRHKFVNELVDNKFIKIEFVQTAESNADLFTKNLGKELHNKHSNKLIEEFTE